MPARADMRVQVISHNVGALYSESRLDKASYSGPSPAGMSLGALTPQPCCTCLIPCPPRLATPQIMSLMCGAADKRTELGRQRRRGSNDGATA